MAKNGNFESSDWYRNPEQSPKSMGSRCFFYLLLVCIHQFVVHIVDDENVSKINETAASLPATESEIELANLTLVQSENISVPRVKEAKVRMECRLVQVIPLGGDGPGSDLFIGEVVRFHIDEEIYEDGRINPRGLNAISRLAGSSYAAIGDIFSIDRPK